MRKIRYLLLSLLLFSQYTFATYTDSIVNEHFHALAPQVPKMDSVVLMDALHAYFKARYQGLDQQRVLTVVDFTKPSTSKRLWVIDMNDDRVLYNTYVTHGSKSGYLYAKRFSNAMNSHESSLGVFLTDNTYQGKGGYSLRLTGLEPGVNDNAKQRYIVVHGATYAEQDFVDKYGRLGRSWGCFAVGRDIVTPLIDHIKDGTLIFAYYPDRNWLQHSKYLS